MGRFAIGSLSPIGRLTDKSLAKLRSVTQLSPDHEDEENSLKKSLDNKDSPVFSSRSRELSCDTDITITQMVHLAHASLDRLRNAIDTAVAKKATTQRPASAAVGKCSSAPVLRPTSAPANRHTESAPDAIVAPSAAFLNSGMDVLPASRFALDAACSPHRVGLDPGQYHIRWTAVHEHVPTPHLKKHPKHQWRRTLDLPKENVQSIRSDSQGGGSLPSRQPSIQTHNATFLTAVSPDESSPSVAVSPGSKQGMMSLATKRPDLSTGGPSERRGSALFLESQVPTAFEILCDGDIKIAPCIRNPEWDFGKNQHRPTAQTTGMTSEPGKYEEGIRNSAPQPKHGAHFKNTLLTSEVPPAALGYQAPVAALIPDDKRSPGGCILDRSLAKDCVANRATNVNDFTKELDRPPMFKCAQAYHDKDDPEACALVLQQQMAYDAEAASAAVLPRHGRSPCMHLELARGRQALKGTRIFLDDRAMRGAHGIGLKETVRELGHTVEQRECRAADGSRMKPNIAPDFGAGLRTPAAHRPESPARLRSGVVGFKRAAAPGFVVASRAAWSQGKSECKAREQTVMGTLNVVV